MRFHRAQPPRARDRGVIWRRLGQPQFSKLAQRQRIRRPPRDATLPLNPFEISDQQQAKIPPWLTTTLSIIGIGITGTNAGNFAQTHTCGTSLVAGASCSISVTFKPTALGTRTATLNISDNGGGSPQRVSLSGTGVAGRCSPRGTQCAPQFPPCCPGLKCTFLGNRAFCEP